MLQINVQPYASDALEDAMRLAQTKALNSYSFSDCINFLNYTWQDIYQQLAFVDEGYYSRTIRLTSKLTKLPPFVKNTIRVYAASTQNTYNRTIYRASGYNDLTSPGTYHISGYDLFCPDAERRSVFLNYVPMQPQLFFTRDNRDPKLYTEPANFPQKHVDKLTYNTYSIIFEPLPTDGDLTNKTFIWHRENSESDDAPLRVRVLMRYRNPVAGLDDVDITELFKHALGYVKQTIDAALGTYIYDDPQWLLTSFICDFPYIFVTYKHAITGEYYSGFYRNVPKDSEFIEYNPFAFTGRNSNVEYLQAKWNDKTGLGVIVKDWNDLYIDEQSEETLPRIKELGWTPDTLLTYPAPELYRLLVARLADKFAALNESEIMGVAKELVEAEFAFKNFIGKDKSAWGRIDNVNGPTISDYI